MSPELLAIDGDKIALTDEEKAWLDEHPTLVVANFSNWPPFDYYENDEPQGYTVELIRLLGSKVGFGVDFVTGSDWLELIEKFKSGQIDVMPSIYLTEERRSFAAFTKSYFSPPMVIVTHENDTEIGSLSDLAGKRVASIVGYANTLVLQEDFPNIEVIQVADAYEGLRAVSLGKVDAFVEGIGVVTYTLDKHAVDGVKIAGDAVFGDQLNASQRMAVTKGNLPLRNILDRALSSLSEAEKFQLHQRWFSAASGGGVKKNQEKIKLTDSEQRWLDDHPVIRLAPDIAWPPIEWVDEEGRYSGLASSYIALIEKKLGVHFEVEKNKNWTEAVQAVKDHELDVFPSIARTLAREKYANFTQPYLSFPTVIVTSGSIEFVNGAEDLMGQKVAVVNGYRSHEYLLQNHPDLDIYPQDTVEDALVAVSKGKYDAFVGNIATASYTIRQKNLTNIKIAGEVVNRFDLSMGVRDDWPELVGILQKAIDSIDGKQHTDIRDKWIGIRYEHVVDYTLLWQILVAVLIVISLMY
ncbi:MAG: transporter substrate-binding domain-containing protein, partial [Porticoccus sp.]